MQMQSFCNTLLKPLVQEWDSGKNKAAPVWTFLNQMRLCGGRLQAEAADRKELINNYET